jgi:hypothetical protein
LVTLLLSGPLVLLLTARTGATIMNPAGPPAVTASLVRDEPASPSAGS